MGLALLLAPLIWATYIIPGALLYLIGIIAVPLAVLFGAYEDHHTVFGYTRACWTWPFMAPYQNFEDSIFGPPTYYPDKSNLFRAIMWSCGRNPISGLRWLKPWSTLINPSKVCSYGSASYINPNSAYLRATYEFKLPNWVFIWQGPFRSCFWWQFKVGSKLYRLWIGNLRLYASDQDAAQFGYRQYGASGVVQVKRVQPGLNNN